MIYGSVLALNIAFQLEKNPVQRTPFQATGRLVKQISQLITMKALWSLEFVAVEINSLVIVNLNGAKCINLVKKYFTMHNFVYEPNTIQEK